MPKQVINITKRKIEINLRITVSSFFYKKKACDDLSFLLNSAILSKILQGGQVNCFRKRELLQLSGVLVVPIGFWESDTEYN